MFFDSLPRFFREIDDFSRNDANWQKHWKSGDF